METYEPIDADEAAAALASVRDSRARVAWAGYPAWYWLATGAAFGGMSYAVLLPSWWTLAVLVFLLFAGTGLTLSARAARP